MNTKGSFTITQILLLAIFLIVLIIVIIFSSGAFSDYLIKIGILTPNTNMTKPPITETQIFRFNTQNNEVQYYDGANIINFQNDAIEFKDKKILYQPLQNTFYNYYHGLYDYKNIRKGNERTKLPIDFVDKIYEKGTEIHSKMPAQFDACVIMMDSEGKIRILLIYHNAESCQGTVYGRFEVDTNNNVEIQKVKSFIGTTPNFENEYSPAQNAEVKQTITNIAVQWSDSILTVPIILPYTNITNKESPKETALKTCVEKRDHYLIADFTLQKETCTS